MRQLSNFFKFLVLIIIVGLIFTQCKKDELKQNDLPQIERTTIELENNPIIDANDIPLATVKINEYNNYFLTKKVDGGIPSSLMPDYFEATLASGESASETKTGTISGAPPKGDLMVSFDLTGSMGGELNNVKINSLNVMTALQGLIPDIQFGIISHMDYNGSFSGCDYSGTYGGYSDFPYNLDIPLTDIFTDVESAANALVLGNGFDGPENYSRPLFESYSDENIGWRVGSKKFVVAFLDNIPHDCNVDGILGGTLTTGPDPGRDEIVGTADDLAILDVLNEMNNQNITLVVLYSGNPSNFSLWDEYAKLTGGKAVQTGYDGTIPEGTNISAYIAGLVEDEISTIDKVTLEVCTPGFEAWLTSVSPAEYLNISLDMLWTADFDIDITVPEGTPDGIYEFDICLIGDGVEYGRQNVKITVKNQIEVPFDIHPTSCPNPLNRNSGGLVPAAILGFDAFDVTEIDIETIRLEGVAPVKTAFEDVATPYYPFVEKELNEMSCNTFEGDGIMDLTLKFDSADLFPLLAAYNKGDVLKLSLTAKLLDGTDLVGEDVVIIKK